MATTTPSALAGGERRERIDYAAILPHSTKLLVLASVLLSLFLAALDQTIVSTALPAIIGDLDGLGLVGWISTAYLLASTAMVPIYGKLSDIYGRKMVLTFGIVVFLIGSALCGIAMSMGQLIAYRVIQGIGAAAITSTAFTVPADLFTPAERPRYMGLFVSVFGLASVVGPFIGGLLTDRLSWHWVFYVNLPLGLIALAFVLLKMPRLASGLRAPIDWLGTVLLLFAVVPLLLGLTIDKQLFGWGSPLTLGLLAVGLVATALFLVTQKRAASPIIALGLFRNRTYAVAIMASVLTGAAFFGAIMFLSLFMVNVLGRTATEAGSAQIPLMLAFVASSIGASAIVQRRGRYKTIILIGFVVQLVGFVLLTQIGPQSTLWDVAWRMVVLGFGMGPAMPLLNLAVQNAVSYEYVGQATANRQFFLQLGQAAGAALFGVLLSTTLAAQLAVNVGPLAEALPPPQRAVVDIGQLAKVSAGEGGHTAGPSLADQLVAAAGPQGRAQAEAAATEIDAAVRQSFAASITRIYWVAIWMAAASLVLTAFAMPELPLRTSNRDDASHLSFE